MRRYRIRQGRQGSLHFPELPDHCDVIKNKNYLNCSICERNKYWDISDKNKTIPTTFIIALSHLIDEYSDEYDIYIEYFGIDRNS